MGFSTDINGQPAAAPRRLVAPAPGFSVQVDELGADDYGEQLLVVRDDLVPGGTKRCYVDELCAGAEEVVYASPVYGGAQVAIAHAARELGIRATIFCAARRALHPRTFEALTLGARIVQVPAGYLSNVRAKAAAHCEKTGARLLPFGLESPAAHAAIARRAAAVAQLVGFVDEVWCVAGSGVLCRGLQAGLRARKFFAVQVGRALAPRDVGAARVHVCPLPFEREAGRPRPPFPSCGNYDAKAWAFLVRHGRGTRLFWNVLG